MSTLALIGYGESVYTRAVRIALAELRLDYDWTGVDPFTSGGQEVLAAWHPIGRVPVLEHAGFRIFETWAILTYLDAEFRTGNQPTAKQAARAAQVAGIVDSYGYWPMVRQVYSHAYLRPLYGVPSDIDQVEAGLIASATVLAALEDIAAEGEVLDGSRFGPADWHLFPMVDAFRQDARGGEMLAGYPYLSAWTARLSRRDSAVATRIGQKETKA